MTSERRASVSPEGCSIGGNVKKLTNKTIYVCGEHDEKFEHTTVRAIINSIASYAFVRAHPGKHSASTPMNTYYAIVCSDVFVFILSNNHLNNNFCLHQLGVAVAYAVPIIMVREPAYRLPNPLPEHFYHTEILTSNSHYQPFKQSQVQSSPTNKCLTLADVLTQGNKHALVYVPHFHLSCMEKLLTAIANICEECERKPRVSSARELLDSYSFDYNEENARPEFRQRRPSKILSERFLNEQRQVNIATEEIKRRYSMRNSKENQTHSAHRTEKTSAQLPSISTTSYETNYNKKTTLSAHKKKIGAFEFPPIDPLRSSTPGEENFAKCREKNSNESSSECLNPTTYMVTIAPVSPNCRGDTRTPVFVKFPDELDQILTIAQNTSLFSPLSFDSVNLDIVYQTPVSSPFPEKRNSRNIYPPPLNSVPLNESFPPVSLKLPVGNLEEKRKGIANVVSERMNIKTESKSGVKNPGTKRAARNTSACKSTGVNLNFPQRKQRGKSKTKETTKSKSQRL